MQHTQPAAKANHESNSAQQAERSRSGGESAATLIAPILIQRGLASPPALLPPPVISPAHIPELQRLVGNRAVTGLLQPAAIQRQPLSLAEAAPPAYEVRREARPAPGVSQLSPGASQVQRALTEPQKQELKQKLGRNKYEKVNQAGKLDEFYAFTDQELEAYRVMRNDLFDQALPSIGQPSTRQTTGQPAQNEGVLGRLGRLAKSLFKKLWAGATAFANSLTLKIESDALVGKLIESLVGKFKLEMTTESLKMGISQIKIPFTPLADMEFGLEGQAKLKEDQEESPLDKLKDGASLDELGENLLRGLAAKALAKAEKDYPEKVGKVREGIGAVKGKVASGAELASEKTKGLFSTASQLTGPQAKEVLQEAYSKSKTTMSFTKFALSLAEGGGLKFFQSQGNKLALSGKGSVRFNVGLGWIKDRASNLIGGPLRDIEAFAKDYLLGTETSEGEQGWGSWTWGKAKGMASALGTGIDYATFGLAGKMAKGVSSGMAWIGQNVLPQWVLDGLSVLGEVTGASFTGWLNERLEFIEKLNPANQFPTLNMTLQGEGKYRGMGQVEDMEGDASIDLSAPESYLGTWISELTDALAKTAGGWKKTVGEIVKSVGEGLSGKLTLFGFKDFSFSWQKGMSGLLPSFQAGPAFQVLMKLVGGIVQAVKSGISWIFSRNP